MELLDALHTYFGFREFRPGQEQALRHTLAGSDTLVVMPTGSGKSLIYQLAGLLLPGVTVVISPLVALMKDQVDRLVRRKLPATFINSSLTSTEQSRRLYELAAGQHKLVLVAPERLRSRAFHQALAQVNVSLLAVDEAHCVSQWGHDFRPDYLHVGEARQMFKAPVTVALTATATQRVQDDIIGLLGMGQARRVVTGFNRPNISFEVYPASGESAKLRLLAERLAEVDGAGLIYTGTRRDAEDVAAHIRNVLKRPARHYHGALEAGERAAVQDAFLAGDLPLVVATNAFGLGIDRPDVRFVLHYSLPGTLEAYYQEAGRAGRDGLPARAMLLYAPRDAGLHEFFITNDSPGAADLRAVHEFVRAAGERGFAQEEFERATGLGQTKLRLAVQQLAAAGALALLPDDMPGLRRMQAGPLPDAALRAIGRLAEQRREHKRGQLARMLDYAETSECRRQVLLRHFGDDSPPEALSCCDNCQALAAAGETPEDPLRPASTQAERAALIVLDTIVHLPWPLGKTTLAKVLKGSEAQDVERYKQVRNYAKFGALRSSEIEALITQLLEAGYLRQTGGSRPILTLSARGEAALKARAAIDVTLRQVRVRQERVQKLQRAAGGTIELTAQMLASGLTPAEIAEQRGLTIGTAYSHLAQLIAQGRVPIDKVIARGVQAQVRAAIAQVGSTEFLAPIKARLPDEIDYSVIRCVVNAWVREKEAAG